MTKRTLSSRLLAAHAIATYLFLYGPIVILVLFSFNRSKYVSSWEGFSMRWYVALWQDEQNLDRARILEYLEHQPGEHVVIVRYGANHDFILDEWVYNNADIDGSKVIWARDMGSQNAELLKYFGTRHAWLVEPDNTPPRLSPYVQ